MEERRSRSPMDRPTTRTLAVAALALAALAAPARATTVLIVSYEDCTSLINSRLPDDMQIMESFDRDPAHWMSPQSDPGMLHWLAWASGTEVERTSGAAPVRECDLVMSFYDVLAGRPNSFFRDADFDHDGISGTPE